METFHGYSNHRHVRIYFVQFFKFSRSICFRIVESTNKYGRDKFVHKWADTDHTEIFWGDIA